MLIISSGRYHCFGSCDSSGNMVEASLLVFDAGSESIFVSGGPKINYRGGRVDATQADNPGVPQPQEDLATHIAAFARQGFTQAEMIGLVACGHTFGGVQHQNFPDIVAASNDPNNTSGNVHFDSTYVTFDNKMSVLVML